MQNSSKGYIPASDLRDSLGLEDSTIRRWVKRGKIADEHYRYQATPGRGRPRLEIDPAGLPAPHRQTWVMAQIESGAWGEWDEEIAAARREIQSAEWMSAAGWRREKAERKRKILRLMEGLKGADLEAACERLVEEAEDAPSRSTVYRWRKQWTGSDGGLGGYVGLLPAKSRRKGASKIRQDDYQRYRALYLTEDRRTARRCYMLVRGAAVEEGRDMEGFPTARTFKNQLSKREDPAFITFMREGEEAWYQKESTYISLDYGDVDAGDVFVADHRQLDVFVRDTAQDTVGRPWLTCWMDMRSWKIAAWEIYVGYPNADRIHLTFKRAVQDFGLPKTVYIDNGKDFRCLDFAGKPQRNRPSTPEMDEEETRGVLDSLGVDSIFALPYNARAKPIERRFRAFIERLEKFLPGYAGSKPTERPEATDEQLSSGTVMPLAEMREHFGWAVEHIDAAGVDGKIHEGRSPNEVWQAERSEVRRVDGRHLAMLCLRTSRPRQIRRGELKVTALDGLYRAEWMPAHGGTKTYARYDPDAPEEVWVFRASDHEFLGRATPKPEVARIAEADEDRAELEAEMERWYTEKRRMKEERAELGAAQPSIEELKAYADAAQAERNARREAEGETPTEEERRPDRSTLIQSEEAQEWLDEAERQEEAGRAPLPYDPDRLDDGDDEGDDIALWPDELDDDD